MECNFSKFLPTSSRRERPWKCPAGGALRRRQKSVHPMPKNVTSRPERPRNGVPPEAGVTAVQGLVDQSASRERFKCQGVFIMCTTLWRGTKAVYRFLASAPKKTPTRFCRRIAYLVYGNVSYIIIYYLKAVVKFDHPRIPAFQPFMKPVSYFLRKQFHAVQCLYQL